MIDLFLLAAALPSAHAACTVSSLNPVNGSTLTGSTDFTFAMSTDCATSSFSVSGVPGSKTPTKVATVRGQQHMIVTPSATDWARWTAPTRTTIVWRVTATDSVGTRTSRSATVNLDLDGDGYTRTDGDTGSCDESTARHPGVIEFCDGIDDDCDGVVEDDGLISIGVTNYPTIGRALWVAADSEPINVCAGTYTESLRIRRPIVLQAPQGPDVTILDGEGTHSILFASGGGATISIHGFTLQNGYRAAGGAIDAYDAAGLEVEDCTFLSNESESDGGAIRAPSSIGAPANVSDSHFEGNVSGSSGGAISNVNSDLQVTNSSFYDNEALLTFAGIAHGGAIVLSAEGGDYGAPAYGTLLIEDSTLAGNYAATAGGAVAAFYNGLTIRNCELDGNSAPYGGAIHADGWAMFPTVLIEDSTISSNTADIGGGIYSWNPGGFVGSNAEIRGNSAGWGGGLVVWNGSSVDGFTVAGNTADYAGGVYAEGSILSNLALDANTAGTVGGGFVLAGGSLDTSSVSNNIAGESGGGIYGSGTLTSVELEGNSAPYGGGAHIGVNSSWTDVSVYGCTASTSGGGIYLNAGSILTTSNVDFGSGATDNSPDDLFVERYGTSCNYGSGVSEVFGISATCP